MTRPAGAADLAARREQYQQALKAQRERQQQQPPSSKPKSEPSQESKTMRTSGLSDAQILAALDGRIEPVRVSGAYRFGLLAVALAMLVLPAIYLALVGLLGWGIVLYAIHGAAIFHTSGSGRGKLLVYLGPLIIGGVLLLFMIKPLFARHRHETRPVTLKRSDQPLLFAYIDKLCQLVGAPLPSRIDVDCQVNASASFRDGFGGYLRRDLVLTIGLPLVAGMDLRHMTGVLAHELGHFAQGTGMRLSYVIRQLNAWFARLVYERDAWDDQLVAISRGGDGNVPWVFVLFAWIARGFVWLTRRVLWLLMIVGHGISSFMLREMEFDADRYEARVAGSDVFARTSERLAMLGAGAGAAFRDLGHAWREKRLCDNLPALVHSWEQEMPDKVRHTITKQRMEGATRWFHTHPSDAERQASAIREAAKGVVRIDAPASALFRNFDDVCRAATLAFYAHVLAEPVRPENLVPTVALVVQRGERRSQYQAARRFFQGLLDPIRPVFFAVLPRLDDRDAAAATLLRARTALQKHLPVATAAAKRFTECDRRHMALAQARALRLADIFDIPPELKLGNVDGAKLLELERNAQTECQTSRQTVDNVLMPQIERLKYALALAKPPAPAPAPVAPIREEDDYGEYDLVTPVKEAGDELIDALGALAQTANALEKVRLDYVALGMLLSRVKPEANEQPLVVAILNRTRDMSRAMKDIRIPLLRARYPYEHAHGQVMIAQVVIPQIPPDNEVMGIYQIAGECLDGAYGLYMRVMSDLASRAEKVESDLGLAQLPEPPEDEEDEDLPETDDA